MKIVIAPDSFKGSYSAGEIADAIENGIKKIIPDAIMEKIPLSDGGEGFLEVIKDSHPDLRIYKTKVRNPLNKKIFSSYGILEDTAIIEMARASGLYLIPPSKRNPLKTTTFGTGELIKKALDKKVKKIILGIGGSATVDCGTGCLRALGVKFFKKDRKEIKPCGEELKDIDYIDDSGLDKRLKNTEIIIACDVLNPLLGRNGALLYAPQKGANKKILRTLEKGLRNFVNVIKKEKGKNVDIAGAGAAGGIGAGLSAFCNAKLKNGFEIISELLRVRKRIRNANLLITGEGKIDRQTTYGKVPVGIAKIAKEYNIPVIAICGIKGRGYKSVYKKGIDLVLSIVNSKKEIKKGMEQAPKLIENLIRTCPDAASGQNLVSRK